MYKTEIHNISKEDEKKGVKKIRSLSKNKSAWEPMNFSLREVHCHHDNSYSTKTHRLERL